MPARAVAGVFALLFLGAAVAAPVPKERPEDTLRRLFGTPADPDKDCKFELDGQTLRITVPDRPHRLVPNGMTSNAPRVTRPVEGDFTATVAIRPPKPGAGAKGNFYAGLFLSAPGDTYLYHTRRVVAGDGGRELGGLRGLRVGAEAPASGSTAGGVYEADSVVFRLTRVGGRVKLAVSKDGADWIEEMEVAADLPDRVNVGVFAGHDGQAPLTAEFRSFAVAAPKK